MSKKRGKPSTRTKRNLYTNATLAYFRMRSHGFPRGLNPLDKKDIRRNWVFLRYFGHDLDLVWKALNGSKTIKV